MAKKTASKPRSFTTPFLFFSEFAETQETYGMTFHEYLRYKWLGAAIQIEEITPLVVDSNGKIKFKVTYYPENLVATSNRNTVPVPDPAGPRRKNKPWDKKKAKGLTQSPRTTTFHVDCVDRNEGPGVNDFVLVVTCAPSLKAKFIANWDTCVDAVDQQEDYSVNDIYKGMAKKGYKVKGLHTSFRVGY